MQALLKKTVEIAKANNSKFHLGNSNGNSHKRLYSSSSSFGASVAATDHVATPPQLPPFDYQPQPYQGPSSDEVFAKRKKYLGPSLFHYYQKPVSYRNQKPTLSSSKPSFSLSFILFLLFFACYDYEFVIL